MKTYDMICPGCGATMTLNKEDEKLSCPYCNHEIMVELEDTPEEIREKEYAKSYGYHKGKYKAEKEFGLQKKKKARKSGLIVAIVCIIVIALLFLPCFLGISAIFVDQSTKTEINPFDYIKVSFSGIDGDGELVIEELINEDIAVEDIRFEASQERDLSVGDKVRITASSTEYKLKENVKLYTVDNLEEYLKNLNKLSNDEIKAIHTTAENELSSRIKDLKKNKVLKSYKPVKLFLITDGKRSNILYDVYQFKLKGEKGLETAYAVVSFDTTRIQKTEPITLSYYWSKTPSESIYLKNGVYFYGFSSLKEVRAHVTSEMRSGMRLKNKTLK